MRADTTIFGEPSVTPFVPFEGGWPVYPPNDIYNCGKIVAEKVARQDVASVFDELVQRGDCGGTYTVLPHSTWFGILGAFFGYRCHTDTEPRSWLEFCLAALNLMVRRPHQSAWHDLKEFLVENIDEISDWASSWKRSIAEQQKIFKGEDGKYYRNDEDGVLIQVIGAKTLDETRMDFITDQVQRGYGFARQFLELFALFSIADDFATIPSAYPPAMKAILDLQHPRVGHTWHFMYHERTRSFSWRPNSNMCDPKWLTSDVLGGMTDTLTVDYFRKRIDTRRPAEGWDSDPRRFQVEYVIDSMVRIGHEEEAYIEFEGTTFRWINGTTERHAIVIVPVEDLSHTEAEIERLNRLLSAIVWDHKHPVRKLWAIGGHRKPYPSVYGPRMSMGIFIDPDFLRYFPSNKQITDDQWLALALFREAVNSGSKFYAFLSYHKVLDLAFPKPSDRKNWLNNVAPGQTREKQRLGEILKSTTDLEEYLREEQLNAIKHVRRKPILNPDDPKDEFRVALDLHLIQDLARLAIEKLLK